MSRPSVDKSMCKIRLPVNGVSTDVEEECGVGGEEKKLDAVLLIYGECPHVFVFPVQFVRVKAGVERLLLEQGFFCVSKRKQFSR